MYSGGHVSKLKRYRRITAFASIVLGAMHGWKNCYDRKWMLGLEVGTVIYNILGEWAGRRKGGYPPAIGLLKREEWSAFAAVRQESDRRRVMAQSARGWGWARPGWRHSPKYRHWLFQSFHHLSFQQITNNRSVANTADGIVPCSLVLDPPHRSTSHGGWNLVSFTERNIHTRSPLRHPSPWLGVDGQPLKVYVWG